jgi:hypothetical protein
MPEGHGGPRDAAVERIHRSDIKSGKRVVIAAHGNSIRALVKYLDQISDDDIVGLNIPTAPRSSTSWMPTCPAPLLPGRPGSDRRIAGRRGQAGQGR